MSRSASSPSFIFFANRGERKGHMRFELILKRLLRQIEDKARQSNLNCNKAELDLNLA